MKFALACMLVLMAANVSATAHELWPAVPPEIGRGAPQPYTLLPYQCDPGPVQNFYHGALYREPPALYGGYAYRPYYRYTAARLVPRRYFCVEAN